MDDLNKADALALRVSAFCMEYVQMNACFIKNESMIYTQIIQINFNKINLNESRDNMFVGRKKELNTLNKAYSSDGFQMIVLYGRRRIGKSTLLREFIKDKKAIYYTCTKVGKKEC